MRRIFYLMISSSALFICTLIFIFFLPMQGAAAFNQLPDNPNIVIEVLRLKVPSSYRKAWLNAEQATWGPWLSKQNGFLGRDLFWDSKNEEATLMIRWASRKDWKSISQFELDDLQERFETSARNETGLLKGNPFPLQFQGEFLPQ